MHTYDSCARMENMNPEKMAMNNLDKRNRIDAIKSTAEKLLPLHSHIQGIIEMISIHPENFRSCYDAQTIANDRKYVERRKRQFDTESHHAGPNGLTLGEVRKLAEVLEYQILNGINVGKWLPACTAIKTSEYDDIANGVDLVVSYKNGSGSGHMGLGVDISFSHNLQTKFQRIKEEIDLYDGRDNFLGEVKYFSDRTTGHRKGLTGIPRVVAALDLGVMEDLSRLHDGGPGHIARHTLVMEMEHQLAVFADYAKKKNPMCFGQIRRAQNLMTGISTVLESENVLRDSQYEKNNKIQDSIEEGLSIFK